MISFSKYSGCGNDFILIDHRVPSFPFDSKALIERLCDRHRGIGADGVIFLEEGSDFKMRIFNRDGSEAEMCGNGLRCFAAFILELGFKKKPYTVQVLEKSLKVEFCGSNVKTEMGDPKDLMLDQSLEVAGKSFTCHTINTGVPHAIVFVDSLDVPIHELGSSLRHHPRFFPHGVNVNFVQRLSKNSLAIRTFERGVEAETLACGTGATASSIIAHLKWQMESPIRVQTKSTETLEINFNNNLGVISHVTQTGPAVKLFHGSFDIRGIL